MHGPPGTGKTSFTQAIAGALNLNLCYLNLSSDHINDEQLTRFLTEAPARSIILMEDIDAMFVQREQVQKSSKRQGLTFSGFLNALDGIRSQEGQIIFMTTNHKEKLDPALLRPGRADVHVHINNASEKQIKEIFTRFFPECGTRSQDFANKVPVYKFSMAKIQGHLLKYKDDMEKCIANIEELVEASSKISDDMPIDEWLHRLNYLSLKEKFEKQKIRRLSDLSYIDEQEQFTEFDITTEMLIKRRLWNMLTGDQETKDNYKYLSKHGIRSICQLFIKNKEDLNEVVNIIPEQTCTGFHLRDIFDSTKKLHEIKSKLYEMILFNKRFPKTLEKSTRV